MHQMCPHCGVAHPPHAEICAVCGTRLLDPAKAAEMREYWLRIPEADRLKAESEIAARAADMRRVRDFLDRTGLWIHVSVAALLVALPAFMTVPAPNWFCKVALGVLGAAGGGAAGYLLHRREGGMLHGMCLIGGAYLLLLPVAGVFGLLVPVEGGTFFSAFAFVLFFVGAVFTLVTGIILGSLIERAYDRGIHGLG
ncbi:MAG TPA: zinc ribbon domain-containing protein [Planctomycetota bacterium]|nr:zinc ribbon domain-containing protein [Planctomycetota bacterium]